ncbi:AAA family ATPase [Corynebacterium bovis]|uniref:Energy-coupling factor transporter ATP-binding protein EcfA2 n=1 Tax=Corynebacterium bovis DSM 20582 = CIP 54.80 TaxID=927655 RepID=A0A8H9YCA4_9CORY|nr:ATP-binding protein [Corynebacterium bovis]MBB3116381.1 energy-coupling factor transporter ATP-binding protein EcfA2 [Corynebacterium bovis DSM 20582 = CIP 54.80]QQC47532.1 AAA family ATPase [Corynebacterium bovis]
MLRIHSLSLDHVAGVRHAELTVPDHGVTVVHGPNERGKSTLLKAFQLLLSDYKSTSSAAKVRVLKSTFADEPTTVAASLTVGPHRLEITKSFNKGAGTCILTVHTPRPERVTGAEAVGRFSEILRSELDADLLAALTVEQGDTPGVLAVAGIGALDRALAGAGAGDSAGDGAAKVTARKATTAPARSRAVPRTGSSRPSTPSTGATTPRRQGSRPGSSARRSRHSTRRRSASTGAAASTRTRRRSSPRSTGSPRPGAPSTGASRTRRRRPTRHGVTMRRPAAPGISSTGRATRSAGPGPT